ncbi:MAG TPA: hypothetical protein VFV81_02705 [Verrucomicrobiae bacterium]|nr:hypothetical protein [Verrucomicrobiae bacterium]
MAIIFFPAMAARGDVFFQSNSIVLLAAGETTNLVFTDPNSGGAVTVALTMTPFSGETNVPKFTLLDTFGPGGRAVHLGVDSGAGGGDGNWVDSFEGANFSATLVSASSGIDTNTIQFGIADIGIRPNGGSVEWASSATTNKLSANTESWYPMDTNTAPLGDYSGQLRTDGSFQISDFVDPEYFGIVTMASFLAATSSVTAPVVGTCTLTRDQFQFDVNGTTGANYIVEATTNLSPAAWSPVLTNAAPFTYSETNSSAFWQRFYRVVIP